MAYINCGYIYFLNEVLRKIENMTIVFESLVKKTRYLTVSDRVCSTLSVCSNDQYALDGSFKDRSFQIVKLRIK